MRSPKKPDLGFICKMGPCYPASAKRGTAGGRVLLIQGSSSNSEKWSAGPDHIRPRDLLTEKQGTCCGAPGKGDSAYRVLGRLPTNRTACPPALGVPPWLYPPPHTHREWGLVCFFHVSASRDRLHEPRRTDLRRFWRPPGPWAGQELEASQLFTEATAQQCPPPRAQEGVGERRPGRGGRAGGALRLGRNFTFRLPVSASRPVASWGPTCIATRRGAGLGRPLGPCGNKSPQRPHRPGRRRRVIQSLRVGS